MRTMHGPCMVKRTFTFFQFHRHGIEFVFELIGKGVADSVHFPRQNRFRQVGPLVASWNVIQAAVLAG